MLDADLVEGLAHSLGDLPLRYGGVLQPECDLAVDGRINSLQLRVLEHEAGASREHAGRGREDVKAGHERGARHSTAVKVRHEAVEDPKKGRLAAS